MPGVVVDEELGVRELFGGAGQLAHVVLGEEALAQVLRIHLRVRGQHAHQQRFARHFQREDADHLAVEHRRVLGDVHGERGFAHRRARRNDDQVRGLQAAGQLVEQRVVGRQAGDLLAPRVQLLQRAERTLDDGRDVQKALPNAVLRELEDGLLGPAQHLLGFVGVVDGLGNGVLRDVDQPAQQRLVAHDANVVLDAMAARVRRR